MEKSYKALNNIKNVRVELGVSQQELAARIGKIQSQISIIEKREQPTLETICLIATALGVHPNRLIRFEEIENLPEITNTEQGEEK